MEIDAIYVRLSLQPDERLLGEHVASLLGDLVGANDDTHLKTWKRTIGAVRRTFGWWLDGWVDAKKSQKSQTVNCESRKHHARHTAAVPDVSAPTQTYHQPPLALITLKATNTTAAARYALSNSVTMCDCRVFGHLTALKDFNEHHCAPIDSPYSRRPVPSGLFLLSRAHTQTRVSHNVQRKYNTVEWREERKDGWTHLDARQLSEL